MLVLIATDEAIASAHPAPDDAVEGELVTPVIVECADAQCAQCQNAWFGLVSHGATRTAMVVDRPGVTMADLRTRVHDWLDCIGVVDAIVQASETGECELDGVCVLDPVAAVDQLVTQHIDEMRSICEAFPVGTEVTRLRSLVAPRHLAQAA